MPTPIIHRQRALSQIGEIRCGGEKTSNAPGRKLETFRLTTQHKEVIDRAAELYGGTPAAWQSNTGEAWQLYTESASLPCLVIVGYSLTRMYELWEGATKRTRACDGLHEELSDSPCVCNAEGVDRCDTVTRLMVMLPETGTSLGWKLRSTGEIAADELDGAMMVAEKLANGRAFVPATLRLTQRRSVSGGQTKRYVVPVLDFDLGSVARPELERSYTPVQGELLPAGVTVTEGLATLEQEPKVRNGKQSAPIPAGDDIEFGDGPVPVATESAGEVAGATVASAPADDKRTGPQARKLNVLVGKLRPDHIQTAHLYHAVAQLRQVDTETMIQLTPDAVDEQNELHWGPLRDTLTKGEASDLIERLTRLEESTGAAQ